MSADGTVALGTLRVESDGDVVHLVLDRPHVLNAMSAAMLDDLLTALGQVADGNWRAVVIRGAGRGFSSGADLRSFVDEVDVADPQSVRAHMDRWGQVVLALRDLPVPSVAAVHGMAYGGGLNLALACDLVLVADTAVLCESYVDIGVNVDLGGSWILPRLVGFQRARRLLLLGERIDATSAEAMGLVAGVVSEDDLVAEAVALASRLADKDPTALRGIRRLLDDNATASLQDALDREAEGIQTIVARPAFQDAIQRFRT